MSAVYRPISISKKILLAPSALAQAICVFFKPCYSEIIIFPAKTWDLGEVSICKSYFSYTLFRGKSYFIWRKIILYLEI